MKKYSRLEIILLALAASTYLYTRLEEISIWLTRATGHSVDTPAGSALQFLFYEVPKVLYLLTVIVFAMGVIRTYFTPGRTRMILAGRMGAWSHVMAALLGTVTPFCSCSAIPLFIGFVGAGVPLGVTFSFLISAPMVNEIALGLLLALFGWKVAVLYLLTGLSVAIASGFVIGKLKMEGEVEPWIHEQNLRTEGESFVTKSWDSRLQSGIDAVREIVGKTTPYIILGIAIGAGIHGYVPENLMASLLGKTWWSVPIAVLVGVPMYSSAAAMIPVVQALLGKGAALGTALAFMMAVTALSLPEMIILRKVLKMRLLLAFVGIVAMGILLVGYLFNLVL